MGGTPSDQADKGTFGQQLILILIDKLVIATILVLAGLWANQHLEVFKSKEERNREAVSAQVQFIQNQLSEFYWPLLFRLEKDNAVWNRIMGPEKPLAANIEEKVILPNHDEILHILDTKSHLMFNAAERIQNELIETIKQYERHVAVYKALRATGQSKRPADLQEFWPKDFDKILRKRIGELEKQRASLLNQ